MKRLFALICLALLLSLGAAPDLNAQDLLIRNARIVDDNRVIERGNIVSRGGRIESLGVGATAEGLTEIDAEGMPAMPAFIDGHRHIIRGEADEWFENQATVRMQEYLDAGFTTLMEGGGRPPGITDLKSRIEGGPLMGPRIITSARANTNRTADEAREQVRAAADAGVDIIKTSIAVTPGRHRKRGPQGPHRRGAQCGLAGDGPCGDRAGDERGRGSRCRQAGAYAP